MPYKVLCLGEIVNRFLFKREASTLVPWGIDHFIEHFSLAALVY